MNICCINNSKIISFIFIICLLIPNISFSNSQANDNTQTETQAAQQAINTTANNKLTAQKKGILSSDRKLGGFFIIGLIINLIMMTAFAVWAFGQWRQNDKKKK